MTNILNQVHRSRLGRGGGSRRAVIFLGAAGAALFLLLFSQGAHASGREEKERAAKKACLSGDYAKGVSLLTDLYVDSNDSTYIFNQGRCYEQGNRCEEAIISFREYLRKTKDAGQVSDGRAERHIADCEELLRKTKAANPLPAGQLSSQPPPSLPPPIAPVPQVVARVPQPSGRAGGGLRLAGAVTFGVGVAAIAAGVGFALMANAKADELEASPSSYERSKESTRSTYSTLSTVGYATGAAFAAGGALLYVLGLRQGSTASASVQPMLTAQTAGALVEVAF
jgi:hypothetical protein